MMRNSVRTLDKSVKFPPGFTKFLPEGQYSNNKIARLQPPLLDYHWPMGGMADLKEISRIFVWPQFVINFKFNNRKPNQQQEQAISVRACIQKLSGW